MGRSGRRLKIHYSNSIHHVMMRGNNRKNIFFGVEYYQRFLQILEESASSFDHKVLAYCLMTNHIHLAIQVKSTPLSKVMQNVAYRYVRWANQRLNRIGHLFQGRYLSKCVGNELNLINLCRYIHLNPVAANMTKTVDEYPWSSHRYYLFNHSPDWIDMSVAHTAIQTKTGQTYREFMSEEPNRKKWLPAFHVNEYGVLIVDDSIMLDKQAVYSNIAHRRKIQLSLEDAADIVARNLSTSPGELRSLSRTRDISKKRAIFTFIVLENTIATITEVAHFLNRSPTAMQKQYIRVKKGIFDLVDKNLYRRICNEFDAAK